MKPPQLFINRLGRRLIPAIPYLWMVMFFLAPFIIVFGISLAESRYGIPPYTPLLEWSPDTGLAIKAQFGNYAFLTSDPLYIRALIESIRIAGSSALICLLLGYPIALAITRAPQRSRTPLLMAIVIPFWTSFLIRVYAWVGILKTEGLANAALQGLGLIDQPLPLLHTAFSVHLGIVYSYLPFMIMPLYVSLERQDPALLEAAADLGAGAMRTFVTVTLPLSMPGVIAGLMLVFIPAVGEFVIPDLLGGPETLMIGKVLWTEFFNNRDWPLASAVAIALLVLLVAPLLWLEAIRLRRADEPS